jgi:hypothetical protein
MGHEGRGGASPSRRWPFAICIDVSRWIRYRRHQCTKGREMRARGRYREIRTEKREKEKAKGKKSRNQCGPMLISRCSRFSVPEYNVPTHPIHENFRRLLFLLILRSHLEIYVLQCLNHLRIALTFAVNILLNQLIPHSRSHRFRPRTME